jgi:hypothetical protein
MGGRCTPHSASAPDPLAGGSVLARPEASWPTCHRRVTAPRSRTRCSGAATRAGASPLDTRADAETSASSPLRACPRRVGVPHVGCAPLESSVPESSTVRPSDRRETAFGLAFPGTGWRTPVLVRGAPIVQSIMCFDKFRFRIASEYGASTGRNHGKERAMVVPSNVGEERRLDFLTLR